MEESKSKLFKQRLFRIHVAAGMTFSIIMYIAIFFGVFAILLPYIKTWEKPSRHIEKVDITKIDYNSMINKALATPNYPKNNLLLNLRKIEYYISQKTLSVILSKEFIDYEELLNTSLNTLENKNNLKFLKNFSNEFYTEDNYFFN